MGYCFTEIGRKPAHKERATALRQMLYVVALVFGFSVKGCQAQYFNDEKTMEEI